MACAHHKGRGGKGAVYRRITRGSRKPIARVGIRGIWVTRCRRGIANKIGVSRGIQIKMFFSPLRLFAYSMRRGFFRLCIDTRFEYGTLWLSHCVVMEKGDRRRDQGREACFVRFAIGCSIVDLPIRNIFTKVLF